MFFHEGVVLVFILLAVEQITTHMSAGPPISSLNLGFLPQINRTLLPTRFAGIESLMNDVFFFFFNQVKSVLWRCQRLLVLGKISDIIQCRHRGLCLSSMASLERTSFSDECWKRVLDIGAAFFRACVRCELVTCSYTVITHLSRPAFVDAVMSH